MRIDNEIFLFRSHPTLYLQKTAFLTVAILELWRHLHGWGRSKFGFFAELFCTTFLEKTVKPTDSKLTMYVKDHIDWCILQVRNFRFRSFIVRTSQTQNFAILHILFHLAMTLINYDNRQCNISVYLSSILTCAKEGVPGFTRSRSMTSSSWLGLVKIRVFYRFF